MLTTIDASEHRYRSGEVRTDLFGAIGVFVLGALLLWDGPERRELAVAILLISGYWVWRSVRAWRRPYVQLSSERLVVFERGRPKHYLELAAVASVRQGFNCTVLLMRDGMKISISHLGFMFSDDARKFRQTLAERIGRAAVEPGSQILQEASRHTVPKYAQCEVERRWLVEGAVAEGLATTRPRIIEDRYVTNTRLRLRKVIEEGKPTIFKLGKKYGKAAESYEHAVNAYLDEDEFNVLAALPAHVARKARFTVSGGALDRYEYPHPGLSIFEIEFRTEVEARAYVPPSFTRAEITHDPAFTGFALARSPA